MTNKELDLALKRFSRCMKENGYYNFIINYILPPGRTKFDLLNDINDRNYDTNFAMLLGYLNLLGPSYKKYGFDHWQTIIKKIHEKWLQECAEKYPEYLSRI